MAKKITAEELHSLVEEVLQEKAYNVKKKLKLKNFEDEKKAGKGKTKKTMKEGFFDDSHQKAEKLGKALMGVINGKEEQIRAFLGDVGQDEVANLADAVGEYVKKRMADMLGMMVKN